MDKKFFEELAKQIHASVPEGVKEVGQAFEENTKQILQGAFNKLDLVTREEFDTQVKVLARTREKVEALEKRVAELEARG